MTPLTLGLILLLAIIGVLLGGMGWGLLKPAARVLAIWFCRQVLNWQCHPYRLRAEPCVVFAQHQDDESLGCGALIARKRNEGLPVHVVFITDGSASHTGHPAVTAAQIGEIRRQEALAALTILGVESTAIHFLNKPDGMLDRLTAERRERLVTRLAGLMESIQPGEIFLPSRPDGSTEHDSAFVFVCAALARTRLRPDIWQFPVWSWWNPGLLLQRLLCNQGCCVQPTEDYQFMKTRALACYRSQLEPIAPWTHPTLPPELVRSCDSGREYFFRFLPPPPGSTAIPLI